MKILSISKNKLTRLPTYLANFPKLAVLKVDHNPLEWPPSAVLDLSTDTDEPETMAHRLRTLRQWLMEKNERSLVPDGVTESPTRRMDLPR
jgi:hypothetical protein